MSADSIDLDGLERKDRAELATIAQAMGGKPGSRAKKADIIAMILELAGVETGAGAATRSASGADGAPDPDAATTVDAQVQEADPGDSGDSGDSGEAVEAAGAADRAGPGPDGDGPL